MADNNYNIIQPVESTQNIAGLTPAKRREERKRRQNLPGEHNEEPEQQPSESVDQEELNNELAEDENGQHSIDYCA